MRTKIIIYIAILIGFLSCNKSKYLDAKPDEKLTIPTTLKDLQAILDNVRIMNGASNEQYAYFGSSPGLLEDGADDYYLSSQNIADLSNISPVYRNLYTWKDQIYDDKELKQYNWHYPYRIVFYANVVLDGLNKINVSDMNGAEINNIKGSALFYRAYSFFQLAQTFASVYDRSTASTDLGIPLRLKSDMNEVIWRSTLQQTYDRIIIDLMTAKEILTQSQNNEYRPTKQAAAALLSIVYLTIGEYDNALSYANETLLIQNFLLDYNTLNTTELFPIPAINSEIIFNSCMITSLPAFVLASVDSNLYSQYDVNDIRREAFFYDASVVGNSGVFFQGSYDGATYNYFSGIATDEVY